MESAANCAEIGAAVALLKNDSVLRVGHAGKACLQHSYVARINVVLDANLLERHLFGRRRLIQHFPQEVVFCPFDRAIHVFEDLIG